MEKIISEKIIINDITKKDSRLIDFENEVIRWTILEPDTEGLNNSEREEKSTYLASLNNGTTVKVIWYDDEKSRQKRHEIFEKYDNPLDVLIVVDMQNDFINGSLGSRDAESLIPNMCEYIKNYKGKIYFTQDTHSKNYLKTLEGKYLPVEHCIRGTAGHNINSELLMAANRSEYGFEIVEKNTFGFLDWKKIFEYYEVDNLNKITLIGVCTDICVVSNALILRALCPNIEIQVIPELCAGTTKEAHEAALKVMKSCQIKLEKI